MTDEEKIKLQDTRRFLKHLVSVLDIAIEQTKYDDNEVDKIKDKAWKAGYEKGFSDACSK